MKNRLKDVLFFGIIFTVVDQILKIVVSNRLNINQTISVVQDFFSITLIHNIGAAFGILMGSRILFVIIGIAALIGLIIYVIGLDSLDDMDVFLYSLLFGGIVGNLIDRIINGYVIDYISFKFDSYNFPIFNFADMCIVISVILLLFRSFKGEVWK